MYIYIYIPLHSARVVSGARRPFVVCWATQGARQASPKAEVALWGFFFWRRWDHVPVPNTCRGGGLTVVRDHGL